MIKDFHQAIQAWIDHGEKIMFFADTNEDITTGKVNAMF